jgi:hypothetical protein
LLIPTPGQTEQEYLGDMLKQQEQAHCVNQGMLDLQRDLLWQRIVPASEKQK